MADLDSHMNWAVDVAEVVNTMMREPRRTTDVAADAPERELGSTYR